MSFHQLKLPFDIPDSLRTCSMNLKGHYTFFRNCDNGLAYLSGYMCVCDIGVLWCWCEDYHRRQILGNSWGLEPST